MSAVASTADRPEQGSIYAYETRAGTRFRFTFRDAGGRQTTRRGFESRAAARRERERRMGRVRAASTATWRRPSSGAPPP
jgi:hypothetical protein